MVLVRPPSAVSLCVLENHQTRFKGHCKCVRRSIFAVLCSVLFLHALASRRRKLEEELEEYKKQDEHVHDDDAAAARVECEAKLAALPVVDCYEKSSSPGGVWRSASALSSSPSTQMYEALWTNGNKEAYEFFDYTFDEHFQRPMPVFLPRALVLEYVLSRVTQKGNIFDSVLFNTSFLWNTTPSGKNLMW